jgi:hypothetical protein
VRREAAGVNSFSWFLILSYLIRRPGRDHPASQRHLAEEIAPSYRVHAFSPASSHSPPLAARPPACLPLGADGNIYLSTNPFLECSSFLLSFY